SNMFCNLNVTDMETCYKVFRTDLLKSIPIRSDRFGFEPEITMKSGKRKLRIYEVPISYHGRTYEEGKKIGWWDGVKVFGVILRYWLIDDLYVEPYGRGAINNITGTPRYLSWMTSILRPYVKDTVLELGAGIGTIAGRLMSKRQHYFATESDALYLHALRNRFLRTPNVTVMSLDPGRPEQFDSVPAPVETVVCLNALEYVDSPQETLRASRNALLPGGVLLLLVPQSKFLFGTVDAALGHKRRFDETELRSLLTTTGFEVTCFRQLNKASVPPWWFFSRVLRRKKISKVTLKLFDMTVWIWKRLDWVFPWKGLSLIAIARRVD
ncbi:MAG: methyltransferase, partial [Bryobacteraceae bacterium]